MRKIIFIILTAVVISICILQAVTATTDSVENEMERLKLKSITSIDGNCRESVCSDFHFDDPREVAFFDLKERVLITDDSTYNIISPFKNKVLHFENSSFAHFPLHLFYAIDLQELDIRDCGIEQMTWENFLMAGHLLLLVMSDNRLGVINEMTFNYASELRFLMLDSNRLRTLYSESFKGLTKLTYLDLSKNRLKFLPSGMFEYLPALRDISLNENQLSVITNMFVTNQNLITVQLRENRLYELHEDAFKTQQGKLKVLDISNNKPLEVFVVNLQVENLVAQNCSLNRVNIYGAVVNVDLADNKIKELYFSQPEALETLKLRNNSLQQIASLTRSFNLRILDLSHNPNLMTLFDQEEGELNSLERLDLSSTNLSTLPINFLVAQNGLRSLNVSHNKLQQINPKNFKYLEHIKSFYIHANDWNCYNLNLVMDLYIKPNNIIFRHDDFDMNFPGEYINGIACMYRLESDDNKDNYNGHDDVDNDSTFMENIASARGANEDAADGDANGMQSQNLEMDKALAEVEKLRKEMKAIVGFYEDKFDRAFAMIDNLNVRLRQFEKMNETMFQYITVTT